MKNILIILILTFASLIAKSTKYYVSTTGNDGADGSISTPWLTWQKGFSTIAAGDTLYIRGGIYQPTGTYSGGLVYFGYCGVYLNNSDGSAGNLKHVFNYPGERPILDGSLLTQTSTRVGIYLYRCDYWYIKGLEVRNVAQVNSTYGANGFLFYDMDNSIFEQLVSHHNGGAGIGLMYDSDNNLVLNCDSYANYDPYTASKAGDSADGLDMQRVPAGNTNTIRGCRFWFNSDDGIDLYKYDGNIIIDSCWFWSQGYIYNTTTAVGDGNGMKLGSTNTDLSSQFLRTVTNNLTFYNRMNGLDHNSANCKMYIYNNTSYLNVFNGITQFGSYDIGHIYRNNVSFDNIEGQWSGQYTNAIIDHNTYHATWQPTGPVATTADFASVDTTGVSGDRQADGSLPVMNFLKLKSSSSLVDAGINVGLPYSGSAPDIGAFEYYQPTKYLKLNGKLMKSGNGEFIIY